MTENLLEQARMGGFNYQLDAQGHWHITAKSKTAQWELQQLADQLWVLVINGIPQINFSTTDAIAFLKRRTTPTASSPTAKPLASMLRSR